jgi:hypothetical protein
LGANDNGLMVLCRLLYASISVSSASGFSHENLGAGKYSLIIISRLICKIFNRSL